MNKSYGHAGSRAKRSGEAETASAINHSQKTDSGSANRLKNRKNLIEESRPDIDSKEDYWRQKEERINNMLNIVKVRGKSKKDFNVIKNLLLHFKEDKAQRDLEIKYLKMTEDKIKGSEE